MNEKTKTLKEREDNMDISDGLYTSEEPLNSKTSQAPSQQTGDTAYFTATSAELEEAKCKMKKGLAKQRRQNNSNVVGAGLILLFATPVVAFVFYTQACRCSGACSGIAWCQFLTIIFSIPFF